MDSPRRFQTARRRFIAPNFIQGVSKRVKNRRGRPDQTNQSNTGNGSARCDDFINILPQQLTHGRCNKLQPLNDELLVHRRAKAEAGNGNAQEGNGKEGEEGKVGNRRGRDRRLRL